MALILLRPHGEKGKINARTTDSDWDDEFRHIRRLRQSR
jgi:hypothetical protein